MSERERVSERKDEIGRGGEREREEGERGRERLRERGREGRRERKAGKLCVHDRHTRSLLPYIRSLLTLY